ncbi:TorD/DmsD family molecular chaperone [Sporomusa termitida]|uniref:Chaperone protein TorD n=1 Tax=Sporomusa termitida TaxID=2377 RepID=A0A517E1K9_9FIRM|nr:molecular chaperone TorD family protein [Sporomusa termitida]QDR83489.1 Chaperone protein TorD [Sporomusa termitida]
MAQEIEMTQEVKLKKRIESCRFFNAVFLTLPDHDFVKQILGLSASDATESRGMQMIRQYAQKHQPNAVENTLQEIAIDRSRLIRGMSKRGPRPPYESIYVKEPPQNVTGSLNQFYARLNCGVSETLCEPGEQIGVELAFVQLLLERQLEALKNGDADKGKNYQGMLQNFLRQHLGRWASEYAQEMERYAQTDFYRGIALLLKDFMQEEMEF